MKENYSSDEENDIGGDQPGINFVKDDTFENILDMSVIENMKKNKILLTTDKMNQVIERYIAAKKKDPNANIINEDFLHLVWSICKMNKIYNKESDDDYILSQIRQNFAYEFLLCCYKLDLSIKNLHPSSYLYELCRDSALYGDSLIKIAFLNEKKPINIKFLYWLEESGYFDKSCSSITLENFIKKRTEQNIGNYEFDSYDEFNQFIGKKKKEEEKEKEKKNEKYEGASVYVTELLKVLKKENKFLEPAELEELAKGEYKLSTGEVQGFQYTRICLKKPQDLTEDDIADWLSQDALYVNKMGISNDKKIYRRQARKKYWAYVKCIFFGDAKKDIRGLFNTKNLSDEDLRKALEIILERGGKGYLFLDIDEVADKADIFQGGEDISWFIDDVKELRNQLLSKYKVSNTEELHNQFLSEGNSNSMLSDKKVYQKENSTRRIVSGAILLLIGIVGCGVVLGIGLASKLAVALLFLFVFMTITGALCLFWKKISGCLSMCCPKISGLPDHQKQNYKEQGQFIDQTYPGSLLKNETIKE
ncbi:MAG: hypothetical protein IJU86_01625 [Firmicutes bacterium]|nr:hypothetical protein [Bacillota bacterium]